MTNDQSLCERPQQIQLQPWLEYPFLDVQPGMHLMVARCWKSTAYPWLRLVHPFTNEDVDFRVLKAFRFPGRQYVIVSPARHWNANRDLRRATVLKYLDEYTVQVATAEECLQLEEKLSFSESLQLIESSDYIAEIEDTLKTLFKLLSGPAPDDLQMYGLTPVLYIGQSGVKQGEAVGFGKLANFAGSCFVEVEQANAPAQSWRVSALFRHAGKTYAALSLPADTVDGVDRPPVVLVGWNLSKRIMTALDESEFRRIAVYYFDASERFNAQ